MSNQQKKTFIHVKGLAQARKNRVEYLRGSELADLPVIPDAWLTVADGKFHSFGHMRDFKSGSGGQEIDCRGKFILPAFVDSHTHLVFAQPRESEFVDKIKGLSYAEIAARGGGILNSAVKLRNTSEEILLLSAEKRLREVISSGTGAIEIKSGYGLDLESELRMLRVIRRLGEKFDLPIRATFLGAHAIPRGVNREKYISEVMEEMIPAVAEEKLARYIDVFCEEGFFTVEESEKILRKGIDFGLIPKIHANQLSNNGGVQLGIELGAISVDHLENIGAEEIEALGASETIATTLPGAAFYLGLDFPPARKLVESNAILAVASDYNPGSAPSGNMQLMMSLACIGMRLTPSEALNAMTVNTSAAMEIECGQIVAGARADFLVTEEIPSLEFIPYSFGSNNIEQVYLGGKQVAENRSS